MIRLSIILTVFFLSTPSMASSGKWSTYIQKVEQADNKTIQALPEKIGSIGDTLSDEQAIELATAISVALVQKPSLVLTSTNIIEKRTDNLQSRFGSSLICSIPGITKFTPAQIEDYFNKAEPALKMAGSVAAECLSTMQDTMEEVRGEATQYPTR